MRIEPTLYHDGRPSTGIVPRSCAVTNRGSDPEGFIVTGNILSGWDREVFISVAAAKEMGRMIGMYDKGAVAEMEQRLIRLEKAYAEALQQLDDITKLHELEQKVAA